MKLNSKLTDIIITKSTRTEVSLEVGNNTVSLTIPELDPGYVLLGCMCISSSTTLNVVIASYNVNASLVRVINNTSVVRNVALTATWLLAKS